MDDPAIRQRLDVIIALLALNACFLGALAIGRTPGSEFALAIFGGGTLVVIFGCYYLVRTAEPLPLMKERNE